MTTTACSRRTGAGGRRSRCRSSVPAPARIVLPPDVEPGRLPTLWEVTSGETSPDLPSGGERAARHRLERWLADGLQSYDEQRDELASDRTSRLSPDLHFGCLSPVEAITRARAAGRAAREFVRQLCWREFYAQLLAANPHTPAEDLHPRRQPWTVDEEALACWRTGHTGYPIVDAGMRQLHAEGWMHNRARLVVAAFLTKTLSQDWRHGARAFADVLVDADVANNVGNWQWVAGTGVDTRRYRRFNPIAQARRHDSAGDYVRRYVPELAELDADVVHEPWRAPLVRVAPEYPAPLAPRNVRGAALEGWRSVQRRGPDGTIESDERVIATRPVVDAADDGARELGERYWAEVRRASLGFVRLRATRDGSELLLYPLRGRLLSFGPAEVCVGADGVACRFPIRGGLLARREGGALLLSQSGGSVPELRAALTGFVPRLGLQPGYPGWTGTLYDQLQRRIHLAISRRFFRSLIEGADP